MQYKLSDAVKTSEKGILINIRVISQSKENKIEFNIWEPRIKLKVKGPPTKGKANEEVIETFKRLLGNCEIISGSLSPKKTLLVNNCTTLEVIKKLEKNVVKDI